MYFNENDSDLGVSEFSQSFCHKPYSATYPEYDIISIDIPSFEIMHKYTDDHILIKCQINDLFNGNIENWEQNRPPDPSRCKEIAKYIYKKQPEIDWLLYAFYDSTENKIKIVDGIHRYTSLQIIHYENSKPPDYITPNAFGSGRDAEWLFNKYVLISLRINPTTGEIIDLFQTLNKSISIPELYHNNKNHDKRIVIEKFAREWVTKYKSHFSANEKPNIPNINRDRFIDFLDILYKKYKISESNSYILEQKLHEVNFQIQHNIPKRTSQKALDKCNDSGCFLFLVKLDVLKGFFL
jgi:hypothetical protein